MPLPFRTIGFDLDGTLLDTSGDLAATLNRVLAEDGRPALPLDRILAMVGRGVHKLLEQAVAATDGGDAAVVARLYPRFVDTYAAHNAEHSRPYPGVVEALDALAAQGITLAVVTNKLEGLTLPLLEATGLLPRFATVIGGDTLGPGIAKPSPAPILEMVRRCGGPAAFVGDSIYDVQAARAAGIPVIACSFGFSQVPVTTLGAEAVIDSFAELLSALETLRPISV
ncbi:HAD-IA family hydrolase [uncultured Sphingomonas sp.]|uniref:HAD-IA family hydrolase n=1 Tax=uncultured Sphingomonas sp. TaxID=158754 RepID=UPI0025E9333C|nr:HAD-IA family hydrolase [uncultured Sphingomonas sp.]